MRVPKLVVALALGLGLTISANPAYGTEGNPAPISQQNNTEAQLQLHNEDWAYRETDDGRALQIMVSDKYKFEENEVGDIKVVNKETNLVAESLPTTATNKDGKAVKFAYDLRPDDTLLVSITNENGLVTEGWWDDWGKCAAGTVGGAGLGGLNGASTGASIGALGGPWTVAAGAIGGGAIGGVSGGLAGAATAC